MVPLDVVKNNAKLACALLTGGGGAVECATAMLAQYPFPAPGDPMWETPTGKFLLMCCSSMTREIMHLSPGAAATVLFPREWRARAAKLAASRLIQAPDTAQATKLLIAQFVQENNCTRAYAKLQLVAARVETVALGNDTGVRAYLTYDSTGCHLIACGADPPTPSEPSFSDMQYELDSAEQLVYLIMTNDMAAHYRRIAYNQPLALGACTDGSRVNPCTGLAFCSFCGTNWDIDAHGQTTNFRLCTDPGCDYMAHTSCNSHPTLKCPTHNTELQLKCIQRTGGRRNPAPVLACCGITCMKGAWCALLQHWPAQSHQASGIALLHPAAIESIVETTDDHIQRGTWHALDPSDSIGSAGQSERRRSSGIVLSRRLWDVIAEAHSLHHLHMTRSAPMYWPAPTKPCDELQHCCTAPEDLAFHPPQRMYPDRHGLGQMPTLGPPALRLTGGIANALAELQVYSEPQFGRMCERFGAAGDDIDMTVLRWLKLQLPMLPGETGSGSCDAIAMHTQAQVSILAAKSRERSMVAERETRHWVVTQVEPILPTSVAHDAECMRKLGIDPGWSVALRPTPLPTPDVPHTASKFPCYPTRHGAFAVRLLMNPSSWCMILSQVILDASTRFALEGALEMFLCHEIDPIPQNMTPGAVLAFRAACIRSPYYGRVYMWLLKNGNAYATSWENDSTGMLARETVPAPCRKDFKGDWEPVAQLCECTDSAYAAFGCGSMRHWQRVLGAPGRPAYLFDTDIVSLECIDAPPVFSGQVHIVPCSWDDMTVDALGKPCIVAVVHRKCAVAPEPGSSARVHYMSTNELKFIRGHKYMAGHPRSAWKHYVACEQDDTDAAYTRATLKAMRTQHATL